MSTRLGVASLAVVLAACGGQSGSSATTPTPTATPYVATESGFSAVFPATPAKQTQKVNQPGINADLTLYTATTNDEQVIVGYEPLPLAPQGSEIQSRLDAGVAGSASNTNGTVLSKSNTTFLGQPAEDAVLQTQGAVVHERIVFFGAKLYIFEGITRTTDAKHPAYDKLLRPSRPCDASSGWSVLEIEEEDGGGRRQAGDGLQGEDQQRRSWRSRQ